MIRDDKCSEKEYKMVKEFIEGFWGITVPSLQGMDRRLFERLLAPGNYMNNDKDHAPFFGALRSLRLHAKRAVFFKAPFKSIRALVKSYSNFHLLASELGKYKNPEDIRSIEFIKQWQIKEFGSGWKMVEQSE